MCREELERANLEIFMCGVVRMAMAAGLVTYRTHSGCPAVAISNWLHERGRDAGMTHST